MPSIATHTHVDLTQGKNSKAAANGLPLQRKMEKVGRSMSPPSKGSKNAGGEVVQRVPNAGNAATYDGGWPNYIGGAFASTVANVLTSRANHNNASSPADPVNANHIRGGHMVSLDYQNGPNKALTVAGAGPILLAAQNTGQGNAIGPVDLNTILQATQNAATAANATAQQIATAAQNAVLQVGNAAILAGQAQNATPQQIQAAQQVNVVAGLFYNNVLAAYPAYAPTEIWVQGGISAGNAGNQLTRVHIIHHQLGAGTNNNGNNIFWGNPGFNKPQIFVEETRMLNFLGQGPGTFNNGAVTLAAYFGGGINSVVAHNGLWYAPANSVIPMTGGNVADGLYATIDAAFNNAGLQYRQVNTAIAPRTGSYQMAVNYNQHNTANMGASIANAVNNAYNNRNNARWQGEDNAQVVIDRAAILAEAMGSISSQVTIAQVHEQMAWNPAAPAPAAPNSAVAMHLATVWNAVANFNNAVQDAGTPRFRLHVVYTTAGGVHNNNPNPTLHNW